MKIHLRAGAVSVLCILIGLCTVQAEEKIQETRLTPIEVIATPIIEGNQVTNYASQVTTVSNKQIEDINALDLPSALRWVPGVNITRYNLVGGYGGGSGSSIFIRGMGVSRPGAEIQTLVDGKPLFQGVFTHPLMDLLNVNIADHIDIYKGAQPVLFGNMAFGVVDLVTKRKTTPGFETSLDVGYGSYNTWNTAFQHGGKVDRLDYYLVGSFKSSDGHRENANGQLQNYYGRVGYEVSKEWDFSFITGYSENWAQDPGVQGSAKTPVTPKFSTKDTNFDLTLSNKYDWGKGQLKVFSDIGKVDWKQWDSSKKEVFFSNTDWTTTGVKASEKLTLWKGGEVLVGYDYLRYGGKFEEIRPNTIIRLNDTYFSNSAPYAAISHTFGKAVQITPSAGMRYNMSEYFGNDLGWQTGIVAQYKDTKLHAQYARAFNLPGVYQVYYAQIYKLGEAWKNLKSEKIDHYETGISQQITSWMKADLTLFWDEGKDRMVFKSPPPHFENLAEFRTRGVEITTTVSPIKDLEFFVGATFLDSTPDNLPYAPKQTASIGVNFRFWEKFTLNMDGQYVASRYVSNPRYPAAAPDKVDAYPLVNAKLSYLLTPKNAPVKTILYLSAENLTNTSYEFLKGYPAPGLTILGGINVAL
jgi:outer membrane cobalamin receptor